MTPHKSMTIYQVSEWHLAQEEIKTIEGYSRAAQWHRHMAEAIEQSLKAQDSLRNDIETIGRLLKKALEKCLNQQNENASMNTRLLAGRILNIENYVKAVLLDNSQGEGI